MAGIHNINKPKPKSLIINPRKKNPINVSPNNLPTNTSVERKQVRLGKKEDINGKMSRHNLM